MSCQLSVIDLGSMAYEPALEVQRQHQREVINGGDDRLLLVEHDPPVITISRRKEAPLHLRATAQELTAAGVSVCETDRGGDITYHGPGQLVAYPILNLNALGLRLRGYVRFLETCVIETLAEFGIEASGDETATGVWIGDLKICAIGVRVSRWVSMHGLALNVTTDLDHFDLIVPCGLTGRGVTSMHAVLGDTCPSMDEVRAALGDAMNRNATRCRARVQPAHHP